MFRLSNLFIRLSVPCSMRSFLDVLLQMFVPTFAKTYPYHSDNDITRSLVGSTFFHCEEILKNGGKEINLHEDDFF